MRPGSDEWIARREELSNECAFGNQQAVAFLAALGAYVELWDDLIDKDKELSDAEICDVLSAGLLDIAMNPWVQAHRVYLAPIIVQMISAYMTSEKLARHPDRRVRQRAFHIRNYPLEAYPAVAFLTGGMPHMLEMEPKIREFFAFEDFDEWEHAHG